MHEVEIFPKNPFDYLKQYSFKDDEKVYTNGSKLIPSFRVETMLVYYKRQLLNEILEKLDGIQYLNCYEQAALGYNKALLDVKCFIKEELRYGRND